jgi:hypothetical protein
MDKQQTTATKCKTEIRDRNAKIEAHKAILRKKLSFTGELERDVRICKLVDDGSKKNPGNK